MRKSDFCHKVDKGASCQPVACDACSRSDISAFPEASPVGYNVASLNKLDRFDQFKQLEDKKNTIEKLFTLGCSNFSMKLKKD